MAVIQTDVLTLMRLNRQLYALAARYLIANDKTNLQTTLATIATNKTTIDAAVAAATNVDVLNGQSS